MQQPTERTEQLEKANKVYIYHAQLDARRVGMERERERLEGEELVWEEEVGARRYYRNLARKPTPSGEG